jgi:hypothetical protein
VKVEVEARQPGRVRRCSWWICLRGSGATAAAARVCGEEMRCSRPVYIARRKGDGRATRGIAITTCVEVGDGRAPREASPFTRPQTAEASDASLPVLTKKTHRPRVAAMMYRRMPESGTAAMIRFGLLGLDGLVDFTYVRRAIAPQRGKQIKMHIQFYSPERQCCSRPASSCSPDRKGA